ncbi:MAG: DUF4388 domain-containing protein [Myxococcaceae bacterium]
MQGLLGDFQTMPLSDLVVYLGNKKVTGILNLERGGTRKQVWLRNGMILNASSNEPREYLGQFLINMGHITEEQFNRAYETQKETRIFLGKILVMIGVVKEETVMSALSLKFRETLLEAFNWAEGNFNFDASTAPETPQGLALEIDLLDVHREGEFRQTAWQAIRSAFPDGEARLELIEQNIPERPKAGSLDERLFALIKENRSIDEMVLALHATDFYLYQRLYALFRLDAVRVAGQVEVEIDDDEPVVGIPLVGDEASPADLLAHAEAFLATGNFGDAEAIARKANELLGTQGTADLLKRAETGLTTLLRRTLLEGGKVPQVLVAPAQLKGVALSAPERYLLSRIDGTRQVAAIVQVSPLRELDALKAFQRFVDAGLVKVG